MRCIIPQPPNGLPAVCHGLVRPAGESISSAGQRGWSAHFDVAGRHPDGYVTLQRHTRGARGQVPNGFWGLPNCEQALLRSCLMCRRLGA